jgi:hypothetical protein
VTKSRILTIVASLLLLGIFLLPIWNISLEAPQYPEPIGMNLWVYQITDAHPHDIKNINLLNHYIGMKEVPEHMVEFIVFPIVIIGMSLLGLIFAFRKNPRLPLYWFILMSLWGTAGMIDFYRWERDYGNSLDPKAAIKFVDENDQPMAYQPPLIGTKMILNFTAHSYPRSGVLFLVASMGLMLGAYYVKRKEAAAAEPTIGP